MYNYCLKLWPKKTFHKKKNKIIKPNTTPWPIWLHMSSLHHGNNCSSDFIELDCFFMSSDEHKDSYCVHRSIVYPQRHSCDMWAHSVPDQTGMRREREDNCKVVKKTTHHHMNCVLLGGETNQNIRVHKQRKKERAKDQVKHQVISKH